MPRISFIPPPMSFNDRGTALVSPIMANAMQLAETFTTEIPRIRMQQEAVAEDKRRFEIADATNRARYEREWNRNEDRYKTEQERRSDADFMQQHAGWEMLMRPDALDVNNDGIPDVAGSVGAKGGVTFPKMAAVKAARPIDYRSHALAYAKDLVTARKKRNVLQIDPTTGKPRVDAQGQKVYADEDESPEEVNQRLRDALLALRQSDDPAARVKAMAIYEQGKDPFDVTPGDPAQGTAWREIRDWALNEEDAAASEEAAATAGSSGTPADSRATTGGGMLSMGTPIHSAMGRMLALQKLDRLAATDPARRARLGMPSDMQIEQLKMQIAQQMQREQQGPGIGAPAGPGAPTEAPAAETPAAEAPAAAAPAPTAPPAERPLAASMRDTGAAEGDIGGNDLATAEWRAASGQAVDPTVVESISDSINSAAIKMQAHPDEKVRSRSAEIQKAFALASASGNIPGLIKLYHALTSLGLVESVPLKTTPLRMQE